MESEKDGGLRGSISVVGDDYDIDPNFTETKIKMIFFTQEATTRGQKKVKPGMD